jgi:hypothetical protein
VDDPPVVADDAATVSADGAVVINVLANDSDADGDLDPSTVRVTSGPSHGTVSIDPLTGAITYTPAAGFAGVDSFTYEVCDAAGLCAAGTVAVSVVALPPTDDLLALMATPAQAEAWRRYVVIPAFLAAVLVIIGLVRRQKPR